MEKMIHTYRLRYLVPFTFPDYQNIYDSLKKNGNWAITDGITKQEQDVYPFILNSFSSDESQNHPGSAWLFYGSENNAQLPALSYRKQGESPLRLDMTEAGIFLFRSRVGFFWYEIQMGKTIAADKLIEIQNQIKELNRYSNMNRFFLLSKDDLRKFTLGCWIAQMLQELSPDITFFAEKKNCMHKVSASQNASEYPSKAPDKALLFTYAVFDDPADNTETDIQFAEIAYELTNGYKKSYKMNPETAADMFRPFQNTLWYAAREGCGYYVKAAGDGQEFFRHGMRTKIINDYFILYVLLLYQSYSLLRFSKSIMENLSAEPDTYMTDTGCSMETLRKLNCEINTFLVKGVHTSVSFVNHQNLFFRYVMQTLNIEADIKSVTNGLNALLELQSSIEKQQEMAAEKQEEEQRRRADDAMNDSLGLLSMLAIISAFTDSLGLISEIRSILSGDPISIGTIVILVVFAVLAVLIFRIAYPAVKLYWRRHKEQKRERRRRR